VIAAALGFHRKGIHTGLCSCLRNTNTNELKPHLSKYWCIPKQNDPSFTANMEDMPGIYQSPYCKSIPVVCMDEKPLQFLDEIRRYISSKTTHIDPDTQLPKKGYCEKINSEYIRCGTASIFMFTVPLGGMYVHLNTTQKGITQK